MSCLRQSVSFHRIAHETGLQGLFLAHPIGAAATRAQFSPQIHADIPETLVAAVAHHSHASHTSQPVSPAHGTMQLPTPPLRRRLLPTEPLPLLTTQNRSYDSPAAMLPNLTPKLRSGATCASLLMNCRGRTQGCRTLPPGVPGAGSPP